MEARCGAWYPSRRTNGGVAMRSPDLRGKCPVPGVRSSLDGFDRPFRGPSDLVEQSALNIRHGFGERVGELLEIFLIKKQLVLFVLLFTDPAALGDDDVEIFGGFCRLYIEKVGPLPRAHPFRKNVLIAGINSFHKRASPSPKNICRLGGRFDCTTIPRLLHHLLTTATLPAATFDPASE